MSNYNKAIGKGKLGINFIKSITDENECYFHEIVQENDVGIDAFIEFTKNRENNGKCIAVQIKTGDSYFNANKTECKIPIDGHLKYWKNHSLEVYGIVCDYDKQIAYWTSISNYSTHFNEETEKKIVNKIAFPIMTINTLNSKTYTKYFKSFVYKELPKISLEEANELFKSNYIEEKILAIKILCKNYYNKKITWDKNIEVLKNENDNELLFVAIDNISNITHNPDKWIVFTLNDKVYEYAKDLLLNIDEPTIMKLLSLIEVNDFSRGTIGQAVECIINLLPNKKEILIKIIEKYKSNYIGVNAFLILSYYDTKYISIKSGYFIEIFNEWAKMVIEFYEEFGDYELYV